MSTWQEQLGTSTGELKMYQLILETTRDDAGEPRPEVRALLIEIGEDGYRSVVDIAESENVELACATVLQSADNQPVAVLDGDDVLSVPDEISPTEAARARYSL